METLRTTLVKLSASDYKDICDLQSNPQSRQFLGGPITLENFQTRFGEMLDVHEPESYWIVRQKSTKAFMGLVCIAKYHDQVHYEVSYELLPIFWGSGYGTEIIQKVIEHGFHVLGLQELYAETQKRNARSIRLLEKVGMKLKTRLERFGEEQLVYSIENEF